MHLKLDICHFRSLLYLRKPMTLFCFVATWKKFLKFLAVFQFACRTFLSFGYFEGSTGISDPTYPRIQPIPLHCHYPYQRGISLPWPLPTRTYGVHFINIKYFRSPNNAHPWKNLRKFIEIGENELSIKISEKSFLHFI